MKRSTTTFIITLIALLNSFSSYAADDWKVYPGGMGYAAGNSLKLAHTRGHLVNYNRGTVEAWLPIIEDQMGSRLHLVQVECEDRS